MKKQRNTKFDYILINGTSRTEFIQSALSIHELDKEYSPGVHSGPLFTVWYTGSRYVQVFIIHLDLFHNLFTSGGKSGAASIEKNHDWEVLVSALLKKNVSTCRVNVEFDIDSMEGFRVRKRVCTCSFNCLCNTNERCYSHSS
jgi:hypothetical protein